MGGGRPARSARIAICMMLPFFILPLFLLARRCRSRLVNVTIDDKFGDERTGVVPVYLPDGRWTNAGQGGAYMNTLHQRINDLPGNISLSFNGVMIYTFFAYWPASQVDLVFFMDGASLPAKRFTKPPYTGSDPIYWEFLMAFQSDELDPGPHNLVILSPGGPDTPLSFDYAIYTVDEPDPAEPDPPPLPSSNAPTSSSPSSTSEGTASSGGNGPESTTASTPASISRDANTGTSPSPSHTPSSPVTPIARSSTPVGAIAGAVAGAALAALLIALAICWRRRRRARRDELFMDGPVPSGADASVTPFPARRANTALPAPVASEKKSHRSGDSLAPFLAYSDSEPSSSSSASASARKYGFGKGGSSQPSEPTTSDRAMSELGSRSEGTAFFRAELERVRAENERALQEIAMLRQVAEPPPYSHTGVIER